MTLIFDTAYANYTEWGGRIDRVTFEHMLPVFFYYMQAAYTAQAHEVLVIEAQLRGISVRLVAFEHWTRFVEKVGFRRYDGTLIFAAVDTVLRFAKPPWL